MVVQDKTRLSFEDFLKQEAKAEFRSEYHDGESRLMAGGSHNHNRIARNFLTLFTVASRGKSVEGFINDVILWLPLYRKSTYPDVMIVEGEPESLESSPNVILNPTVIVEVLSDSTEAYDRGDKFKLYRSLPSFREYILISQDTVHVDQFVKTEDAHWLLTDYDGQDAVLNLKTVPFEISLKDLYDKVILSEASSVTEEKS
jgi:Uma2 family endonuclease